MRDNAVIVSVLTPAETLIAARRLAAARPHVAAIAGIVRHEDLWQLCRDELTGVDVRAGGWDIRGRWFGVVVGATLSDVPDLAALGGPVLVPGVGAQGGRPDALRGLGDAAPGSVLPAVSREVLRAGPDVAALRAAGERMRDAVAYLAG